MIYLIDIELDTDGSLLATCKAFPELTTFGKDKAQVWKNALGALEEAIAARIDDGDPLPAPATEAQIKRHKGVWVKLPLMTSLKCMLYSALREAGMNRAELARRLDWHLRLVLPPVPPRSCLARRSDRGGIQGVATGCRRTGDPQARNCGGVSHPPTLRFAHKIAPIARLRFSAMRSETCLLHTIERE